MSTPNPLIPQGSLQAQGTSNVRVAVATIVAIHVVFFGGLLLQGCKRDTATADAGATNAVSNSAAAPLSYAPINSDSLYYTNNANLPPADTSRVATANPSTGSLATAPQTSSGLNETLARYTNTATTQTSQADAWNNVLSTPTPATPATAESGPGKEYTVARGDSFAKIAKTQGTTVSALRKANPSVDPAKIRPGQKIVVPAGAPATGESSRHAGGSSEAGNGSGSVYTVKPGDTLTKIAKTHGVTIGQLRSANNLKVSRVNVGQKLKIPAPSANTKTDTKTTASAPTNTPTF